MRHRIPGNAKRWKRKGAVRGLCWKVDSEAYDRREAVRQAEWVRALAAGYTIGRQSLYQLARDCQRGVR